MVTNLNQWALKWQIPFDAVEDLRRQFGIATDTPQLHGDESEAAIQTRVRLEAAKKNIILWRNNVGVLTNKNGVPIRYGLANDSKQLNKKIKSSDLIGIRRILITQKHVGSFLGQFIAREIKKGSWTYANTKKEQAQLKFIELVNSFDGDGCFTIGEGTL
jgi:hypothetical protein